jgi:serine/threonine protein kinase
MSGPTRAQLGNYELLELIGDGAEGRVYRARCIADGVTGVANGEYVAVKRLKRTGDDKESVLFDRQTQILRKLNHPNIISYKDSFVWRDESTGEEVYCLVTELLEGEPLKTLLDAHRTGLPWSQARGILDQTIQALQHANSAGVVHRDLKPSNIFITKEGNVKLIDFGIARHQDSGATTTSSSANMKGSFDYMSPDFVADGNFRGDEQSDVFSFGVCFYEVLTGTLPFPGFGANALIGYVSRWHAPKPPEVNFKHTAFRVLLRSRSCLSKCLRTDRNSRYRTFNELMAEFSTIHPRKLRHGNDEYEYLEYLGKGGFGEVFRARRLNDGMETAIKEMLADRNASRFVREAKILKEANHPNLVQYLDFVEVEEKDLGDQRRFFLVLEYLKGMPGASLRDRIRASEAGLDPVEALGLFVGYLDCLDHLHKKGIIHRDIKPGNLYAPVDFPSGAKVFDLGIAHDVEGTYTHGQVPGTLDYMPPEFASQDAGRGSAQSDIYSIGVTLYQTLTKKLPFPRLPEKEADAWVAFYQRAEKPPECSFDHPVFREYPELAAMLKRALAADGKKRFPTAKAMRDEIEAILRRVELVRNKREYESAMAAGKLAMSKGDFEEAVRQASRAMDLWPGDGGAKQLLATAQDGKVKKEVYNEALAAGREALARGDFDEAMRQAKRAQEGFPGDPGARELYFDAHEGKRKKQSYETAITRASDLLEKQDFSEAAEQAVIALKEKPDDQAATEYYRRAQDGKLKKELYGAAVSAAEKALDEERPTEAKRQAERALELQPGDQLATGFLTRAQAGLAAKEPVPVDEDRPTTVGEAPEKVIEPEEPATAATVPMDAARRREMEEMAERELARQGSGAKLAERKEQEAKEAAARGEAGREAARKAAQQEEEARKEAARQEAFRQEEARREAARQEAARQKAAREASEKAEAEKRRAQEEVEARERAAQRAVARKKMMKTAVPVVAALVVLAAIGAGVYFAMGMMKARERQKYEQPMAAATSAFGQRDFETALTQAQAALGVRPGDDAASRMIRQCREAIYTNDLAIGQSSALKSDFAGAAKAFGGAAEQAKGLSDNDKLAPAEAGARYAQAVADSMSAETTGDDAKAFEAATNAMASGYAPTDAATQRAGDAAMRLAAKAKTAGDLDLAEAWANRAQALEPKDSAVASFLDGIGSVPSILVLSTNPSSAQVRSGHEISWTIAARARSRSVTPSVTASSQNESLVTSSGIRAAQMQGVDRQWVVTAKSLDGKTGTGAIEVVARTASGGEKRVALPFELLAKPPIQLDLANAAGGLAIQPNRSNLDLSFSVSDDEVAPRDLTLTAIVDPPDLATVATRGSGATRNVLLSRVSREGGAGKVTVTVEGGGRKTTHSYPLTVAGVPLDPAMTITGEMNPTLTPDSPPARIECTVVDPASFNSRLQKTSSQPDLLPPERIRFEPDPSGQGRGAIVLAPLHGYSGDVNVELIATASHATPVTNTLRLRVVGSITPPTLTGASKDFTLEVDDQSQVELAVARNYDFGPEQLPISVWTQPEGVVSAQTRGEGWNRTLAIKALRAGAAKVGVVVRAPNGASTTNIISGTVLPAEPPEIAMPQGLSSGATVESGGTYGPVELRISDNTTPPKDIKLAAKSVSGHIAASDIQMPKRFEGRDVIVDVSAVAPEGLAGAETIEIVATDALGHSTNASLSFMVKSPESRLTNSVGMVLVWVRGLPGAENSSWNGRKGGGWVGQYEVTQDEFNSVLHKNPSKNQKGGRYPVENMTYNDAVSFCDTLTRLEQQRLPAGWHYSLPSESQWAFVGAKTPVDTTYAFFAKSGDQKTPEEVGLLKTNSFGLYDVLGNVAELTRTRWHYDNTSDTNYFVRRGGGFQSVSSTLSEDPGDYTYWVFPGPSADTGFRVILTPASGD